MLGYPSLSLACLSDHWAARLTPSGPPGPNFTGILGEVLLNTVSKSDLCPHATRELRAPHPSRLVTKTGRSEPARPINAAAGRRAIRPYTQIFSRVKNDISSHNNKIRQKNCNKSPLPFYFDPRILSQNNSKNSRFTLLPPDRILILQWKHERMSILSDAPSFADSNDIPTSDDKLTFVRQQCRELGFVEDQIQETEESLSRLKNQRRQIAELTLPDLFSQLQIDSIGDASNRVDYVLSQYVAASLPKDPDSRQAAIDWLITNGHEDIVGTTVTVEFTRGELEVARQLYKYVDTHFTPRKLRLDEGVHHSTLAAFIRRMVDSEEPLPPLELLGARVGPIVKVKVKP